MDYTITAKQHLITPEYAGHVMQHFNVRNRTQNESAIRQYIEQMLRDAFYFTHQGIARDRNGHLMDGQHRLMAIIKSGKSMPMFEFTYSIDLIQPNGEIHPVMMVFDKGRPRTVAQNLGLNNMANASLVAAICNAIRGFLLGSGKCRSDEFIINAIYSVYIDSIDAIISAGWGRPDRHAIMMSALVLLHTAFPEQAMTLAHHIASMEGLRTNMPEKAMNTFFRGQMKTMTGATQRIEALDRLVNGCLKFVDNEPVKALCSSQSSKDQMLALHATQKTLLQQQFAA